VMGSPLKYAVSGDTTFAKPFSIQSHASVIDLEGEEGRRAGEILRY
jgi:hypothetical protein